MRELPESQPYFYRMPTFKNWYGEFERKPMQKEIVKKCSPGLNSEHA